MTVSTTQGSRLCLPFRLDFPVLKPEIVSTLFDTVCQTVFQLGGSAVLPYRRTFFSRLLAT